MNKPFEIHCTDGLVFRCEGGRYRWQYALVPGRIDVEDKSVVEVFLMDEEGEEILSATFASVIAVGAVTVLTTLEQPRLKMLYQCPRCGFTEVEK